jgi:hypothetical protein
MNRNKIDRLFAHKLGQMESVPSPAAWEKVQKNLQQKRRGVWVWWGMAAAVSILAAFVVLTWGPMQEPSHTLPIAHRIVTPPAGSKNETPANITQKPEEKIQEPVRESSKEGKEKAPASKGGTTPKNLDKGATFQKEQLLLAEGIDHSTPAENSVAFAEGAQETAPREVTANSRKTIIYSIGKLPVVAQAPTAPEPDQETILAERESTGLKKIVEIAKEVRTGEVGMADIREVKNELLAFNFKRKEIKDATEK